MKNNFDLSPLGNLNETTKPLWGKMNPQHMVEHLILAVQYSNGKVILNECMNLPDKYPTMKRFLLSSKPLPKNFVNTMVGEGLKPLLYKNLETAKQTLISEIENFELFYEKNPDTKPMNPTFGPLNKEEWIQFHIKHFTHHFTQFGLLEKQ